MRDLARRRILAFSALGVLAAAGHGSAAQSAGNVFQQSAADGLVVVEAENFGTNTPQGGHTWDLVTAPAGFQGAGAMQSNANSGAGVDTGYLTGAPRLDFRILFVATGTHYVWVRGRALTTPATGNNDSCHAGLDGAAVASADRLSGWGDAWTWRRGTMDGAPATVNVAAAGIHTVNLWMREDGFLVDRVLLTTNANYGGVTEGGAQAGPAQSPQIPVQIPAAPGTLTATGEVSRIRLGWGAAANADTYTVLRSTTMGGPYTVLATGVTGLTYVDTSAAYFTLYFYRVLGVDTVFGPGPQSNEASATALTPPPRTNGHEEGLLGDDCACGSSIGGAGPAWAGLLLLALLRRRR